MRSVWVVLKECRGNEEPEVPYDEIEGIYANAEQAIDRIRTAIGPATPDHVEWWAGDTFNLSYDGKAWSARPFEVKR